MSVTMLDIAKRLNISQATVSRVLNGKGTQFISLATRDRVARTAVELGYRPNRLARSLVTGKTGVVALWVRNPDAPYYAGILRCVHERARSAGYEMILSGFRDRGGEPPIEAHEVDRNAWPVDAVLAVDCPKRVGAYLEAKGGSAAPVVCMGSDVREDVDCIAFDPIPGVEAAARHLLHLGRNRLAHLTGECSINKVRISRAQTFARVVRGSGTEARIIIAPDETRASAREAMLDAWKRHGPFDGVFCINDDVAIGAYRALRDLKLRIPEDVALIGCDNIEDTQYLDSPLTTIEQPVGRMCDLAWQALEDRFREPRAPTRQMVLPTRLIVRASTVGDQGAD